MKLLRLIGNVFRLTAFVLHWLLYWPAYYLGSKPAAMFWIGVGAFLIHRHQNNVWIYAGIAPWVLFRLIVKTVPRPRPLVLFRGPAPPPAPPPSASAAKGRADDPNEATVIGRLDPKLRGLLHRQADDAAS